ncbi:MAG: Linear gramicidin synthase subunit D [Phycisphaerae bacterium]|nr:Linear gramicidin synthase subunit D [Phycisphaerae bacterium]
MIGARALVTPDAPAIIDGNLTVSYGQLVSRVETQAARLHALGVRRGDRVGVHLSKSVDELVGMLAVLRLGAVFVNIHPRQTLDQLVHAVGDCRMKVLLAEPERAAELAAGELSPCLSAVLVRGTPPAHERMATLQSDEAYAPAPTVAVGPRDLASIIYTSGSTGQPKGVMLTHGNWIAASDAFASNRPANPGDRLLLLNPLSFSLAINQVFWMFRSGGTVVMHRVMLPAEIVDAAVRQSVTIVHTTPVVWVPLIRYLMDEPREMPDLRLAANGGGALPPNVLEAMGEMFARRGVAVFLGFGITEVITTTCLPSRMFLAKMGAMGLPHPNVELFVVDPDRGLCGPDEEGELIQRGPINGPGYWNNPAATAEKFKPNPHLRPLIGDEAVFHSGDIVRRDRDGVFWFVGRRDSLIKCAGVRISPTQVEDALHRSGLVGEAVAFGAPDERMGQVVHVAVGPGNGQPVDEAALSAWCRGNLSPEMVPRRFHVWDWPMPQSPNGKPDRWTVIEACRAREGKP